MNQDLNDKLSDIRQIKMKDIASKDRLFIGSFDSSNLNVETKDRILNLYSKIDKIRKGSNKLDDSMSNIEMKYKN